jgi:alkanesulfonate monooxygenase SsuD/methylene tetrahydromethanopterin reductase-like flavin-dependent oxidoreductase (luciferase family)
LILLRADETETSMTGKTSERLRLGMFVMPIHNPAKPLARCIDEDVELAVECERLGFDEFWVGEHHTSTLENIVMPEIFIAKALALTKSMRFGPAPVCLQYHHPVHVANRLAFLDHLSHGRLNVCFGPGAIPTDMEVYGVDPKDMSARVGESADMILKIWTSNPPYEISGKYWNVSLSRHLDPEMGLGALHKPLQNPHPPISIPSISRRSVGIEKAAARGFSLFSHHMISAEVLIDQWATYREAAQAAGRQAVPADWRIARNVFVAETTKEARQIARSNSMGQCIQYILDLTRRGPGVGMWKRNADQADEACNLDYFLDEVLIVGDPPEVTRQLLELRKRVGDFGTLVLVAHDWDDRSRWLRSLELFAKEVRPALVYH